MPKKTLLEVSTDDDTVNVYLDHEYQDDIINILVQASTGDWDNAQTLRDILINSTAWTLGTSYTEQQREELFNIMRSCNKRATEHQQPEHIRKSEPDNKPVFKFIQSKFKS